MIFASLYLLYLEVNYLRGSNFSISILQKRLLVISVLITFLFSLIVLRLGFLQIVNGGWLQAKAVDQWTRDVPLKAKRGTIYDKRTFLR